MKPIERIAIYIHFKKISPHAFEKKIELSNGYFSKQLKHLGSVGSDILIRIHHTYTDLDILWVLTGEGQMLIEAMLHSQQIDNSILEDFTNKYTNENKKLKKLENDFDKLQTSLSDKEKIIGLYEFMLNGNPPITSTSSSVVNRMDA
jgi:DNA-binding HxlR family transcriptional regulator